MNNYTTNLLNVPYAVEQTISGNEMLLHVTQIILSISKATQTFVSITYELIQSLMILYVEGNPVKSIVVHKLTYSFQDDSS